MGSGSSKGAAATATSALSSDGDRWATFRVSRVFNPSCFRLPSTLSNDPKEENGRSRGKNCTDEGKCKSSGGDHESCRKLELARPSKMTSVTSSDPDLSVNNQDRICQIDLGASSSSTSTSAFGRSSNTSSRFRSRFGFNSDGIGFRLSRAVSLGSSGACAHFSANLSIPNSDGHDHVWTDPGSSSDNRNDTRVYTAAENISSQDVVRNDESIEAITNGLPHRNHVQNDNLERRRSSRCLGPQESLERSVRFGRTLSVGRLRDRVLRGTSLSEGSFASASQVLPDSSNNRTYHRSNSMDISHNQDSETPQLREASNRDLLEHRSSFLERRRRIRSQVRALQRLGSRFENLSGHDRTCILSGQHRTGHCTCRTGNLPANPDDHIGTRASISRIVMLAEALFEVLDEIHQQTVVLSARPSFSSIGSGPAPNEVVECMPVKVYMKPQKHQNEEAEQCYVCLVEYGEGDCMRILPCKHEFHQTCIDKWLKEIHRVCPLCRGDVCRADASRIEKLS